MPAPLPERATAPTQVRLDPSSDSGTQGDNTTNTTSNLVLDVLDEAVDLGCGPIGLDLLHVKDGLLALLVGEVDLHQTARQQRPTD